MLADIREKLGAVLADHGEIAVAYLFGSAARGDASSLSDIDVGVLLADEPHNRLRYRAHLGEELSRAAAGIPVEVVLLDEASPAIAARAVRQGRQLLCQDPVARVRFEIRTFQRDFDTARLRALYDQTLGDTIRQGRFYG